MSFKTGAAHLHALEAIHLQQRRQEGGRLLALPLAAQGNTQHGRGVIMLW